MDEYQYNGKDTTGIGVHGEDGGDSVNCFIDTDPLFYNSRPLK